MYFTPYVMFLFLITTHMAYAEEEEKMIITSTIDISETTKDVTEIVDVNHSKIIIEKKITCEIEVKIPKTVPEEFFIGIVRKRKFDCPVYYAPPQPVQPRNDNPERPA